MTQEQRRLLMVAHDHMSPGGAVQARFAERGYDVTEVLVVPPDRELDHYGR